MPYPMPTPTPPGYGNMDGGKLSRTRMVRIKVKSAIAGEQMRGGDTTKISIPTTIIETDSSGWDNKTQRNMLRKKGLSNNFSSRRLGAKIVKSPQRQERRRASTSGPAKMGAQNRRR